MNISEYLKLQINIHIQNKFSRLLYYNFLYGIGLKFICESRKIFKIVSEKKIALKLFEIPRLLNVSASTQVSVAEYIA